MKWLHTVCSSPWDLCRFSLHCTLSPLSLQGSHWSVTRDSWQETHAGFYQHQEQSWIVSEEWLSFLPHLFLCEPCCALPSQEICSVKVSLLVVALPLFCIQDLWWVFMYRQAPNTLYQAPLLAVNYSVATWVLPWEDIKWVLKATFQIILYKLHVTQVCMLLYTRMFR